MTDVPDNPDHLPQQRERFGTGGLDTLLDVVTVTGILLTITVLATGGFREWTPFGRLSVTSWIRPIVIALVAAAVRHWLRPRPPLPVRLATAVWRGWKSPTVRAVMPIFLFTRTGVFVCGFLAIVLFGYRPGVEVPWRFFDNEFLNLPARWDTGWYLGVAMEGYQWFPARPDYQQNIAFFPVYPMLMRYGSLLFAREVMWTGVLISWLSFFGAIVYLFRLADAKLGAERALAVVALLASYPFAFFYSTAYTESLFLLTIVGACFHFERDELWQAGLWGLTAGLTRPNGCVLSVVLALMAIRPLWPSPAGPRSNWDIRTAVKRWRPVWPVRGEWMRLAVRIAIAAAPGIGMLIYSTYIYYLTGHPLRWAMQNAAWGRVYKGLDALVAQQAQIIGDHGLYSYAATRSLDALQAIAVVFVLVTVWPVFRRFGLAYAVLILVNLLPPLMMGGLLSTGRVTAVLFPTFLWLGAAVPATHRAGWIALFAMLQAICAALFFTWRPLY